MDFINKNILLCIGSFIFVHQSAHTTTSKLFSFNKRRMTELDAACKFTQTNNIRTTMSFKNAFYNIMLLHCF